MSDLRTAGLALAMALVLHGRAHPAPLDDAGLTTRALESHARDDCKARGVWRVEASQDCMSRATASASRIGTRLQEDPSARPQFWRCLDRLEAGALRRPNGGSHMDRVDACMSRINR